MPDWFKNPYGTFGSSNEPRLRKLHPNLRKMVEDGRITLDEAEKVDMTMPAISEGPPSQVEAPAEYGGAGTSAPAAPRGKIPLPYDSRPPAFSSWGGDARQGNIQSRFAAYFGQTGAKSLSPREQANADNESRYAQAMASLGAFGRAEGARLTERNVMEQAKVKQMLINRGLGNQTVVPSVLQGVQERTNLGYMDLAERIAARRIGLLQSKQTSFQSPTRQYEQAHAQGYEQGYQEG